MKFNEVFKNLRENRGLTQIEMAEILSLSKSTISMWEKGNRMPIDNTLIFLSNFFGVSIDYLLTGGELRDNKNELLELLNEEESYMIKLYRNATEKGRAKAEALLEEYSIDKMNFKSA